MAAAKDTKVDAASVAAAAASGVAIVGGVAKVDWAADLCLAPLPDTQRGYGFPIYFSPHLGGVITYGSGNLAFIRNVKNPAICDAFTSNEHKGRITVVQLSPNGEWLATGDEAGTVCVWGSRPGQHVLKNKVAVNKRILDIAWSFDSQRIAAVGDGAESKAKVFDYASGNNFGTVDGHSQRILSVAFKPTRPFRLATCGEDMCVNFYEGPPFKWSTGLTKDNGGHTKYPNAVRYHPGGDYFVSVGSDSKIFVFDGKAGKMLYSVDSKENHKGTITSCAFSLDGKQLITSSMDKTAKLWNVTVDAAKAGAEGCKIEYAATFAFGGAKPSVSDMQVSTTWTSEGPVSVSLSGAINILDEKNTAVPKAVIQGHQGGVRGFALDKKNGSAFTTDDSGVLLKWDVATGLATAFAGCSKANDGGKGLVACAVSGDGSKVITVGLDDKFRYSDIKTLTFSTNATALGGQPTALAAARADKDLAAVTLSQDKLVLVREGKVLSTTPLGYTPRCVAFAPGDKQLAIGGADSKLRTYSVSAADGKVALTATLEGHINKVNAVTYSDDGVFIAATDGNRQIILWKDGKQQNNTGWTFHNAAPVEAAFSSPAAGLLASAAADQDIIVWSDLKGFEHTFQRIVLAHPTGVEHISFVADNKIISTGADRCIRTWTKK